MNGARPTSSTARISTSSSRVPKAIAEIAYGNKAVVYGILFRAAAETLRTIAADPKHLGAEIGFFLVLHTWGQQLQHHPHVHCVVTGGGLSRDGTRWIACRPGFFLPVRVLSRLFRRLFLQSLQQAFEAGRLHFTGALAVLAEPVAFARHLAPARQADWVVYAKRPFAGPRQVLDYVGRYTHRVAISNNRLIDMEDDQVRFRWKDYRAESQVKTMTLAATEFLRRFLLHVLPAGFQRIRYYGLLGNRHRAEKLARCRALLGTIAPSTGPSVASGSGDYRDRIEALTGVSLRICPVCHEGQMVALIVDAQHVDRTGRHQHVMRSRVTLIVSPLAPTVHRRNGTRVAAPRRDERPHAPSASPSTRSSRRIGSNPSTPALTSSTISLNANTQPHSMPIEGASG